MHNSFSRYLKRILLLVISLHFLVAFRIWRSLAAWLQRKPSHTCVILYYHVVTSEQRLLFYRQLRELKRWTTPLRADHQEPLKGGRHYSVVTFDDGFECLLKNALPGLIHLGIPATIFFPTGYLGKKPGWISAGSPNANEQVLNGAQIQTLPEALISIGSHTVSHPNLASLSHKEIATELEQSKHTLEKLLNREVILFSFPHGEHNPECLEIARRIGYQRVFTIQPTLAFDKQQEYVSGRLAVSASDWLWEFRLKLLGGYCWLPYAYAVKQTLWRGRNSS